MQYIPIVLRSVIIITLFSVNISRVTSLTDLFPADQILEAIRDCMNHSPAPWPDEWKREYMETIHSVIDSYRDVTHFDLRLQILRKGFGPYWESFRKISDRSFFELHCARIRWYTEHLMGSEFPTDRERQKLRDQFTDIWNYAANLLLQQFPFFDPNTVEEAKAEGLSECYRKIDAPLMPVYLKPMSDEQVEEIKQRWDKLRYARIDLWLRLNGDSTKHSENCDTLLPNAKRDYELTKESLSQLLGLVWMVIPNRPDYYLSALENRNKALKHRFQSKRHARSNQQRLEKMRSRQLIQTEHISFLLVALLESTTCLDESRSNKSIRAREQIPSEQQDKIEGKKEVVPMS
jgi:hypothetical protein